MVQVIYTFKQGSYPFGKGKQTPHTYMQYLLYAKDEQQVEKYRQFNVVMKKLRHENIMRLEKVLKEDMTFHMIYEFHNKSLQQRLKEITDGQELVGLFVELENVFECLVGRGVRAQLYIEYMAVDEANSLKVWLKPDQVQLLPTITEPKTIRKQLLDYYDTERTRIHLQIEQIFETSQNNLSKKIFKNKQIQATNIQQVHHHQPAKHKTPNFVIEGNTLVFLNAYGEKAKMAKQDNSLEESEEKHPMTKANHGVYQQWPIVNMMKVPLQKTLQQAPDISKMSVAEKVLYYKKLKQMQTPIDSNQLIVKDSSTTSQQDLSKSSGGNDSNMQIKTQMINKNKIKIITSQQVQVEGNSDDDLEKLAREKLAKIKTQKGKGNDSSTEIANKSHTSANSEKAQKKEESFKQINSKIAQAKLKAKNILEKYGQRLKK